MVRKYCSRHNIYTKLTKFFPPFEGARVKFYYDKQLQKFYMQQVLRQQMFVQQSSNLT